jgi:hypothetical protein
MKSKALCWLLLFFWLLPTAGCALCLAGAVGGAAGYEGHKRGYKLQSPVEKDKQGYLEFQSPVTKPKQAAKASAK